MKTRLRFTTVGLMALGTLFLILAGCSTDSPTEPEQPPLPGGVVTGRWAIAIDSSANTMEAGGDSIVFAATISNRDTATPPPDGATVIVSTTLGLIGDPTTGSSALVLQTFGGGVVFEVFSGVDEGTATVEVAFQNAMARRDVMITRESFLFIASVTPNSSSKTGGVTVVIDGENFAEPLQVTFVGATGSGGALALGASGVSIGASSDVAQVSSVTSSQIVATVPEYTAGALFDGQFAAVDVKVDLLGAGGTGGATVVTTYTAFDAFTYFGFGIPASCGNSQLDEGEDCDDGNTDNNDDCRNNCVVPFCGDGLTDSGRGEECDDANGADGDGCRDDCTVEECGDGIPDPQEECDDGNVQSGDGCSDTCELEACGNGVLDTGEQCDDGDLDDTDDCPTTCEDAFCGDGFVEAGEEECDDGNLDNLDGCDDTCAIEP
ncbi:MAG: DUF4215 domain-containing protein [Acidobacteriota bacterium]|nr:DUF4215 domain-containing protein [Acidobacteriota bacterium]